MLTITSSTTPTTITRTHQNFYARHYPYCPICKKMDDSIQQTYTKGGIHGALYCVKGHKLTGKKNDLHLIGAWSLGEAQDLSRR